MLYPDKVVPVPQSNVTVISRTSGGSNDHYVVEWTESWADSSGKRRSPGKRATIGRVPAADVGPEDRSAMRMHPNENYYTLHGDGSGVPEHDYAQTAGPGRRSRIRYGEPGSVCCPGVPLMAFAALVHPGLYGCLVKAFGETVARQVSFPATHFLSGRTTFEKIDCHPVVHNVLVKAQGMTSQTVPEFFRSKLSEEERWKFFSLWIPLAAGDDAVGYDVTYAPAGAKRMAPADSGCTHGGPSGKRQLNFALFVNERTSMPLYCLSCHGSINDSTSLLSAVDAAPDRRLSQDLIMVMDRSFPSLDNLRGLRERGVRFLMGVPESFADVRERLTDFGKRCDSVPMTDAFDVSTPEGSAADDACVAKCADLTRHDIPIRLYLMSVRIDRARKQLEFRREPDECRVWTEKNGTLPAEDRLKAAAACFTEQKCRGRKTLCVYDREKAPDTLAATGCFALIASPETELPPTKAYSLCRMREADEQAFDQLKNDLNGNPLAVHDPDVLQGRFFTLFIAPAIRRQLLNTAPDYLRQEHTCLAAMPDVLNSMEVEMHADGSPEMAGTADAVTAGFIRTVVGSEVADRPEIKDYASDRLKRRQREAEKKKERDKAAAEKTARLKKERFGRKKAPGKPRKVVIMDKDAYEAEQTAREAKSPKS